MQSRVPHQGKVVISPRLFATSTSSLPSVEIKAEVPEDANTLVVMGAGGTIAGVMDKIPNLDSGADLVLDSYTAGVLSIKQIMEELKLRYPQFKKFKNLKTMDLYNIDSCDMTPTHWLNMAKAVKELFLQPEIKGVVITMGTDTLEEAAYFLYLWMLKMNFIGKKSLVVVGAMRPADAISADGPDNLMNALAVADSDEARYQGPLVVFSNKIFSARDIAKTHTTAVNAFNAPNSGFVGEVTNAHVRFTMCSVHEPVETPFDLSELKELPRVKVLLEYPGSRGEEFEDALKRTPDGIILMTMGNSGLTPETKALLPEAKKLGIPVGFSSRTGSGFVTDSQLATFISSSNLNGPKLRILMMVTLAEMKQKLESKLRSESEVELACESELGGREKSFSLR